MLSSFAPLIPRDAHALLSPTSISTSPPPSAHEHSTPSNQHRRQAPARNPVLAALDAEEAALITRKSNVRRFGATWLRPPGVSKTYQAMVDEAAERAEQEAIARREEALAEQHRAQEEHERNMRMNEQGVDGVNEDEDEEQEEGMERNLDEEVPEAEGVQYGSEGEDEEGERDLDEDVPEAGSYEHTDTEVEESSSEDEGAGSPEQMAQEHVTPGDGSGHGPTVVQSMAPPNLPPTRGSALFDRDSRERQQRAAMRLSGASGVSEGDSSIMMSSPTLARPPRRAQQAARSRMGRDARNRLS